MPPNKKLILNTLGLSVVLLAIVVLSSFTFSLAKGGFDEAKIFDEFIFRISITTAFLLGTLIVLGIELYVNKGDNKYGDAVAFSSQGEKPSWSFFKRFSGTQLFLGSLIIFSSLGLLNFALVGQSTYTGVGLLETQQFTATDSLIFSSLTTPASENLGSAFIIAIFLLFFRKFARKYNLSEGTFVFLSILLGMLIVGLFGLTWHIWAYGGSDLSLMVVFFFWAIGGFITLITGTFIPFWVMHIVNNFLVDVSRFLSNDFVLITMTIVIFLMSFLYLSIYNGRLFGKKGYEPKIE